MVKEMKYQCVWNVNSEEFQRDKKKKRIFENLNDIYNKITSEEVWREMYTV